MVAQRRSTSQVHSDAAEDGHFSSPPQATSGQNECCEHSGAHGIATTVTAHGRRPSLMACLARKMPDTSSSLKTQTHGQNVEQPCQVAGIDWPQTAHRTTYEWQPTCERDCQCETKSMISSDTYVSAHERHKKAYGCVIVHCELVRSPMTTPSSTEQDDNRATRERCQSTG